VDGINAVVAAIQQKRSDTHWENCEDGGSMMTFNMVKNYVTSIATDTTSALASRQSVYGVTCPFPPRYSDRYMSEQELDTYATRSFMFGGPRIFMNRLAEMGPEQLAFAASEIAAYKVMRARIRGGKVFHLTGRPEEGEIDAIQGYDETTDSAVAVVTRGRTPRSSLTLRLRGLDPQSLYRVRFQTDQRELIRSGAQLMGAGVRVALPSILSAEVVFVDPE
jgi:alpha-galactosidase